MNRAEHVAWCKSRALQYVDASDLNNAFASLVSDLRKHPETADHGAIQLGAMLQLVGQLNSPTEMREFIKGVS